MFSIDALFCHVDDLLVRVPLRLTKARGRTAFCQAFEPLWRKQLLQHGFQTRQRARRLCLSEIMTILIVFHSNHYRNFKHYYLEEICQHFSSEFPNLPSYQRFVEWMPSTLLPLCVYLKHCFGQCSGISFLDSTSLKVRNALPLSTWI